MCGIFGAIGKNANLGIIRALAIVNRERGSQSFGLFDSNGKAVKGGIDPLAALGHAEFAAFINNADRWFLAGHTRKATHGKVNDTNAHPFRYGRIIGAHNGIVHTPRDRDYRVDSEYLFDQLDRCNGDYQTALADVSGYWGLCWFDGESFYLQAHNNSIAIGLGDDGVWYFSSDEKHLAACMGSAEKIVVLDKGRTIKFTGGADNPVVMADFVSTDKTVYDKMSWQRGFTNYTEAQVYKPVARTTHTTGRIAACGLPVPDRYNRPETKKQRKRRERQERKAAAELAASYGRTRGGLDYDELEYADELAEEAGYGTFDDFMCMEGITSEQHGIRMLEDARWAGDGGYDDGAQRDLFEVQDEQSLIVGLDEIPF